MTDLEVSSSLLTSDSDLSLTTQVDHWNLTWKIAMELTEDMPLWYLPYFESGSMLRLNTVHESAMARLGQKFTGMSECFEAMLDFGLVPDMGVVE